MITIAEFCEKYELEVSSVYSSVSNGTIPSIAISREAGRRAYINENFFLRRKDFDLKVHLYNQDMYYYLSEFFSDSDIARAVVARYGGSFNSFVVYMSNAMFEQRPATVMQYKVPDLSKKFFRFGRVIERYLRKRNRGLCYILKNKGKEFSISYLLDMRMNNTFNKVA